MGEVILEVQTTIDGYMASEDGNTDWAIWNWAPEWTWDRKLQDFHISLIKSADGILLSSGMVEGQFLPHWREIAAKKKSRQKPFAEHLLNTTKYIFSSRSREKINIPGGWDTCEYCGADLATTIGTLRKKKKLIAFGGARFVRSLIEQDLVDEFNLLVNPAFVGKGMSVFPGVDGLDGRLKAGKVREFECGVRLLRYKRR